MQELEHVLLTLLRRHRDFSSLRIGTGGGGLLFKCSELPFVLEKFDIWKFYGPNDSLLSWLLIHQPQGYPSNYTKIERAKNFFTYRYNMLDHIGSRRSHGEKAYPFSTPRCRGLINGAGILAEEHYPSSCQHGSESFHPCKHSKS